MPRLFRATERLARLFVLGLLLAVVSSPLWAQCAMCRQAAASQQVEAIRALNAGIILLAIPPAAIIGGIAWFTYRHRNGFQDPTRPKH